MTVLRSCDAASVLIFKTNLFDFKWLLLLLWGFKGHPAASRFHHGLKGNWLMVIDGYWIQSHFNTDWKCFVLRDWQDGRGEVELKPPAEWKSERCSYQGYVQFIMFVLQCWAIKTETRSTHDLHSWAVLFGFNCCFRGHLHPLPLPLRKNKSKDVKQKMKKESSCWLWGSEITERQAPSKQSDVLPL